MSEVVNNAAQSIALPQLNEGETNAGIQFENGKPHHWVLLLPGDNEGADHDSMLEWAKEQGGDLPSPEEHMLLRANLPGEFKRDYYWSNRKERNGYAWYTDFSNGHQYCNHQSGKLRGRAVRRSFI